MTRPGRPWVRVRYGVYVERATWERLDDFGQQWLRDRACLLVCDKDAVLSHSSAGRRLGLALLDVHPTLTHLTRRRVGGNTRTQAGITHHRGMLPAEQLVDAAGVPATDPLRTSMDIAQEYGFRAGVVTADSALHQGADKSELMRRVELLDSEPYGPTIRAVAEFADGGAQTPIESTARILLASMGVTDVVTQHPITLPDRRQVFADLYSPEFNHVLECDGRVKYRQQFDNRGRLLSADDIVWQEKLREDQVRGLGYGFSRITWRDTLPERHEVASRRLWREIELQSGRRLWIPTTG